MSVTLSHTTDYLSLQCFLYLLLSVLYLCVCCLSSPTGMAALWEQGSHPSCLHLSLLWWEQGLALGQWLYSFPRAAISEYHKLGGLNECKFRTSLVVQVLRSLLPIQGTWVPSLAWEDSTCCGAAKPMYRNYWAWVLEPRSYNKRSLRTATGESLLAAMMARCSQK